MNALSELELVTIHINPIDATSIPGEERAADDVDLPAPAQSVDHQYPKFPLAILRHPKVPDRYLFATCRHPEVEVVSRTDGLGVIRIQLDLRQLDLLISNAKYDPSVDVAEFDRILIENLGTELRRGLEPWFEKAFLKEAELGWAT